MSFLTAGSGGAGCLAGAAAYAAMIVGAAGFGVSLNGSGYASRWDASPTKSRGLDGGLTYNVGNAFFNTSGYAAFASQFTFSDGSDAAAVQSAVESALGAWTAIDPTTNYEAGFAFTDAVGGAFNGFAPGAGAEIDILGQGFGDSNPRGFTNRTVSGTVVRLTSDVAAGGGAAINGADIALNTNATWTAEVFAAVLTHELGIALGLNDVDVVGGGGTLPPFYDDNYDGTNPTTAFETLTNSWADQIDPFDPEGSPVVRTFNVANGEPGFDTPGVDIVLETQIPVSLQTNLILSNDDFAGRQFLYPIVPITVPEPGVALLLAVGIGSCLVRRRRRQ